MNVWNWLKDSFCHVRNKTNEFYGQVDSYYHGTQRTWFFIKGHTLPLPQSHIKNEINAEWKYSNHSLTYLSNPCDTVCKLSWLSAKICVVDKKGETEYDIDSFLENFRLHTYDAKVPTLTTLFLSWCAETQQWFQPDSIVQFHVIDHDGKDEMLSLHSDNHCFEIRDQKLYHQFIYQRDNIYELHNPCTYYHA